MEEREEPGRQQQKDMTASYKAFDHEFAKEIQDQMGEDVGAIYTYLEAQEQEGKQFVAYPDLQKLSQPDLECFETMREAVAYCNEMSSEIIMFDYNHIQRVEDALTPLVQEKIEQHFEANPPDKEVDKGQDEEMEM